VTTLSSISHQIRARRRELGLSLSQLARRVDTSPATLSRYESGWTRFEVYTLRKLATALDCELVVELRPKHRDRRRLKPSEVVLGLRRLFWDRPLEEIHLRENTLWVIERVIEYGNLDDVRTLVAFIGRQVFLGHAAEARFSSDRTRVFWHEMLSREGIPCTRRFSREGAATSWRSSIR
jgi:transcriptional regulator with XRE-family HTH domain